jgi:hypothetical protein
MYLRQFGIFHAVFFLVGSAMIFQHGYPGVVNGEFGYFQAVQRVGFSAAHRQMLVELKKWFEENMPHQSPFMIAFESYRVHKSFLRLVASSWGLGGVSQELEKVFAEVFGRSGRAIIEGETPRSHSLLDNTPGSWTLPQRIRARSKSEILNSIQPN